MLRLAENNSELGVVSDQVGAPTSAIIAAVIAELVLQLSKAPQSDELWGTFHFSGYPFVSWADFALEVFEQATHRGLISGAPVVKPISSKDYPTPAKRPANSRLDCSKLKRTSVSSQMTGGSLLVQC